jgi:hypothetical protein
MERKTVAIINSRQLGEEIESIRNELGKLIGKLREAPTPLLAQKFAEDAIRAGMKPNRAMASAEALTSWRNSALEELELAEGYCGSLSHVVAAMEYHSGRTLRNY